MFFRKHYMLYLSDSHQIFTQCRTHFSKNFGATFCKKQVCRHTWLLLWSLHLLSPGSLVYLWNDVGLSQLVQYFFRLGDKTTPIIIIIIIIYLFSKMEKYSWMKQENTEQGEPCLYMNTVWAILYSENVGTHKKH